MRKNESSSTARGAAALRAAHLQADPPHIFEDPFALAFAGEEWEEAHARGSLRETFRGLGLERLEGQIVGRARWAEDALQRGIEEGITQYVNVGAGLDSFVLRRGDLLDRVVVIELDHPASQSEKRAVLEAQSGADHNRCGTCRFDLFSSGADLLFVAWRGHVFE